MQTAMINFFLITALVLFQPKPDVYHDFFKYITSNANLQKQARNSCEWQYALIKVKCNKANKIISHSILNPIPGEIKQQLLFLDGYQFNKKIPINQHAVIFCITLENHKPDCVLKSLVLPTKVLEVVFSKIGKQMSIDPRTIILHDILSVGYFNDTIE